MIKFLRESITYVPIASVLLVFFIIIFSSLETSLASAASQTVIARQQVTAELSMTVASTSLTLLPAIPGLTGGTGNASTSVTIVTSDSAGYNVTIKASGTVAVLNGDVYGGHFNDYSATVPETWTDTSSGQASQFGFGITNGTLSSANGASGYSSCTTVNSCYSLAPTTTPKTIVSVTTNTPAGGDTFYLKFRAHIPANPNPVVPQDWYTATTTLTATAL